LIFTLQSHEIEDSWDEIKPLLNFGCIEWTPEFVKQELIAARAQLWCIGDERIRGIVITQIMNTPHTWGLLWIASGRGLKEGMQMLLDHIEPWLWSRGCEFIQIAGRTGWKVLPGYKPTGVEMFVKVKQ
jgi:hypothetical protein